MNKEFRVWIDAVEPGKFIYPESITFYKDGSVETPEYRGGTVQQYTGLTDSTGKKIFEGDIVDYRYDGMSEFEKERYSNLLVSPVYWEYERWRIKYSAASYAWHLMKVIGNIFETPELLKS